MVAQLVDIGIDEVEASLAQLVGALDVDRVRDPLAMWKSFDRLEKLAASAKLLLAAKVEAAATHRRHGCRSAEEQLAKLGGTTKRDASRAIETSKQLAQLPATAEALRRGELSLVQASEVASAAVLKPDAEHRLLALAATTNVHELREECQRARRRADPDPEATHRRIHRERSVRQYTDAEGAWNCHVRGTPERGAAFMAALDEIVDERFRQARTDGDREPREAYAFDALMTMAERAKHRPAATTTKRPRTNPRYTALLRADLAALVRGEVEEGERCEIAGVGPVPVSVARGLLSDAILKLVITKGVDVANVVHLGRGPTAAQKIALLWTSPKCANEACSRTIVDIDHTEPWVVTRHTKLDELEPLCRHDHMLKTHEDWSLFPAKAAALSSHPTTPATPETRPHDGNDARGSTHGDEGDEEAARATMPRASRPTCRRRAPKRPDKRQLPCSAMAAVRGRPKWSGPSGAPYPSLHV
jgi:hypothetical protein